MMVATYNCGCPPPPKDQGCCSPCCGSGKSVAAGNCPPTPSCSPQLLRPMPSLPDIEETPACCPMPPFEDIEEPPPLRSEIAGKGLPYTELEAIINNNRIIIRTQKEEPKPEFDPPCDCVEDPSPKPVENAREVDAAPAAGTRTVTLYPRANCTSEAEVAEQKAREEEEEFEEVRTIKKEENPNIFVLRVKKTSTDGDKRFNVDLEFKTARPWSLKKRLEIEDKMKGKKAVETPVKKDAKKEKRSGKKKKKK